MDTGGAIVTVRVEVPASMLAWAIARAGIDDVALIGRFPKLLEWLEGVRQPTLRQLEDFARATRTPLGYLLLPSPPAEEIPLPDLRTVQDAAPGRPSPDLLETIAACQDRQDWYRAFARSAGQPSLEFVGSVSVETPPAEVARLIASHLDFELEQRQSEGSWSEAFRAFVMRVETAGILVMISGVVGSNTHRRLKPEEFRGFVLTDDLAPAIFINGADAKAAQIFTLAHELGHVWLGQSALDNPTLNVRAGDEVERWCNQVAAEFLVPTGLLRAVFQVDDDLTAEVGRLARYFRVSTLVVLHSLFDARLIGWDDFQAAYTAELESIRERPASSGGDFYRTQPLRVSRRFAAAVIESTLEGETLYRDAYRLLGFRKHGTFEELRDRLGVA